MPQQQHEPHSSSRSKSCCSSLSTKDTLPSAYTSCSSAEGAAGGAGAQAGGRSSTAPNTQQQQDAADAAMYRDMREALAVFDAQQRKLLSSKQASTAAGAEAAGPSCTTSISRPARMPPRQTAFYAALRSVLQQVLAESTPAGRHTRLLAAHAWYVGHKPRPVPANPDLAVALAASLSLNTPASPAAAGQSHARLGGSRAQSPTAAAGGYSDSGSSCSGSNVDSEDSPCAQQQASVAPSKAGPGGSTAAMRAQRLEAAASSAFSSSWPKSSSSNGSCAGSSGSSEVPGLIPVGCLPSSRFGGLSPAAATAQAGPQQGSAGSCRGAGSLPCHPQQQQQQQHSRSMAAWSAVVAHQAAIEAEVAGSVRGFAQQRARIEENISRRQELAAVMAATAAATAQSGGVADRGPGSSSGRALQHVDSQHQPSQVAAQLLLTASGAAALPGGKAAGSASSGSAGVQLVVPDRVKAARKQHLQEGVQECSLLQESLGLPDSVLARALLPPPDVPYMAAFAQLPSYKPAGKAAGKKAKRKTKEKKQKSGKSSSSKAGKAAKSGPLK